MLGFHAYPCGRVKPLVARHQCSHALPRAEDSLGVTNVDPRPIGLLVRVRFELILTRNASVSATDATPGAKTSPTSARRRRRCPVPICSDALPVQRTPASTCLRLDFRFYSGRSNLIKSPAQTQRRVKRMGFQALYHQPSVTPKRHQNPRQNLLRAGSGVHPGHQGGTLAGMIHRKGDDNLFLHAQPR